MVKPAHRPMDEWRLEQKDILLPLRFAEYADGSLGPWQYRFVKRCDVADWGSRVKKNGSFFATQILYKDIFSLLWYLERRALYDAKCLECLYPREWTDPMYEQHAGFSATRMPAFDQALANYTTRVSRGDLYDSDVEPCGEFEADPMSMGLQEKIDRWVLLEPDSTDGGEPDAVW